MKSLVTLPILILCFICCSDLRAQETWSLERCVRYALDNSLSVKGAELSANLADVTLKQVKQDRFPSLNVSSSGGLNFGRVINPATNDFETENATFSNIGASSSLTLFQGGSINNTIRQADADLNATHEDILQTKSDLGLQVALSYLSVLFAEENLVNAQSKLELTQQQLEQVEKMIAAGSLPESDRYDVLAQIALDQQDIVRYENDRVINLLDLKHLMHLEPDYPLVLQKPEISLEGMEAFETYTLPSVYSAALENQPKIKAQNLRIESARLGEHIAQALYLPRLSVGGSIGTSYSDFTKQATGYYMARIPTDGVFINGEAALFEVERNVPTGYATTPFFDQYDNNLGYGFSLSLQIPIYNHSSARAAVSRAKIQIEQQELSSEQIKQTLKTDIQNALAAARAAREALDAANRAFDAASIAYTNAERKFGLGAINNYDFISARNRLDTAKVNRTIAKYDYLFKAKIIEYYLGRGLTLDN